MCGGRHCCCCCRCFARAFRGRRIQCHSYAATCAYRARFIIGFRNATFQLRRRRNARCGGVRLEFWGCRMVAQHLVRFQHNFAHFGISCFAQHFDQRFVRIGRAFDFARGMVDVVAKLTLTALAGAAGIRGGRNRLLAIYWRRTGTIRFAVMILGGSFNASRGRFMRGRIGG